MTSKKKESNIKISPALKARYPNLKPIYTKPQFLVWLLHKNPYSLDGKLWRQECIIASKLLKRFPNWDFWNNLSPKDTFGSLKIVLKNNSYYNSLLKKEYENFNITQSDKYLEHIKKCAKFKEDEAGSPPLTGEPIKIKKKFDFLK
jgi:hypothetical protein